MDIVFQAIMSLYFTNTLVPRNDLNTFKIASSKKKVKSMQKDVNYLIVDGDGLPLKIIMNRYKSDNTYGQRIFDVTKVCAEILKNYMKEFNRKPGDFLFVMKDGSTPFTKENFLTLIRDASKRILGKPININLIRKIQISDYYSGGAKSIEDDEKDAERYLHSLSQHKEYFKLDLDDDE
jgi:hypothetical protein